MLVAGEASGDTHAANMFTELKKRLPNVVGMGMGGSNMAAAGIDLRFNSSEIGVIGMVEVLRHYPDIKRALTLMQKVACEEKPDLLICVDYKEFNYKLAKKAKACGIKVLFYVSPQVWAWRPGRVKKYGKIIDMMAVIFPFEVPYYEAESVPVRYVGHPSVDKVHPRYSKGDAMRRFGLDSRKNVVGIFPGSRVNEIKRLLPVMLAAAKMLQLEFPEVRFVLSQAPSVNDELLGGYLQSEKLPIRVVKSEVYDVIQCCDAIMTSSGTATLEMALMGVPMVVSYRLAWLTYILGRLLVKTPYICLVNIIAGKKIVEEYIQYEATPNAMKEEIARILTNEGYAARMCFELADVKNKLGSGGGSENMARLAAEMLKGNNMA